MAIVSKSNLVFFMLIMVLLFTVRQFFQQSPQYYSVQTYHSSSRNQEPAREHSESSLLILYNRIPKTGSTSFMSVVYNLHSINKFSAAYVNVSSTSHRFTFLDQYKFAINITKWDALKPAMFHGHFPFLDFISLGFKPPLYINIVRKPLDRLVSYYYFVRYGDTFLPNKKRKYQGDTRTFDDCVKDKDSNCHPNKLWLQIPYFCGSDPECWKPGNKRALQRAKFNIVHYYFLVGVTERINNFVEILEKTIPKFFKGATEMFTKDGGIHIRQTKVKKELLPETIKYFQETKVWQMENELYQFVRNRFEYISQTFTESMKVSYQKVKQYET